jgi:hypothetical protein
MKNPDCPNCGRTGDTFADVFWCPKCRIKYARNGELLSKSAYLLQCKNAFLTNKEFHYREGQNWEDWVDDKKVEEKCWLISSMKMAIVENNGSLGITFNDGTKKIFQISADVSKADVAGLVLFGGVGSLIAGNMALKNQKIANTQRWATTINMLISKGTIPEMIFCRYCGTKNKSEDSKCIHCGAILT